MDWTHCLHVEVDPRIHSGAPVLRGTRMPVDAIVDNFDYGVSVLEISRLFDLPQEQVEAIVAYAESQTSESTIRIMKMAKLT